jgi:multisubunit Na+/H+ antiporter MnhB subunit
MLLLDQLQHLSPPLSFCALLACGFLVGLAILILVRVVVRAFGKEDEVLPIRDTLIAGFTGLFALIVAFSAAGIWNDAIQARATVQREANAIENLIALGSGLPEELAKQVHDEALQIGRFTVEEDWPAMQHRTGSNEDFFNDFSQSPIVKLMILISRNEKVIAGASASALLSQLVELRSARVQREAIARGGISGALWFTLLLLPIVALTLLLLAYNHDRNWQLANGVIYVFAVCLALFVILVHDRPFFGYLGVRPTPIERVLERNANWPIGNGDGSNTARTPGARQRP